MWVGLGVCGILAGVVGFGCGLRAYGVKKGLFVGVLPVVWVVLVLGGIEMEKIVQLWKICPLCKIVKILSISICPKIKGETLSNPTLELITHQLINYNFIIFIGSNSLNSFPLSNKTTQHIISPFIWLIGKDFIN